MEKYNSNAEDSAKKKSRLSHTAAFLAGALTLAGIDKVTESVSSSLNVMEFAADKFELSEGQGLSKQNIEQVRKYLSDPNKGLTLNFTEEEINKMDDVREFGISDTNEAAIRQYENGEVGSLSLHFSKEEVMQMGELQDIFSHIDLSKFKTGESSEYSMSHSYTVDPRETAPVTVDLTGTEKVRIDPVNPDSDPTRVDL